MEEKNRTKSLNAKNESGDPLVLSGFVGYVEKIKKNERGGFASSFRWPDLAFVVLVVSVKSVLFSLRSVVWRKRVTVRVGHFLLHKKRQLKTG